MKKIIIPLLLLATSLWAETEIKLIVRIDLPGELFGEQQMDLIDENDKECASLFTRPTSKDNDIYYNFHCGTYGGVWRTVLDSNILFAWSNGDGVPWQVAEFYLLTGATHTLREVIEDEFTRYKKCDCFTGSDSVFNSIFTSIDFGLVPAIERELKSDVPAHIVYDIKQSKRLDLVGASVVECLEMVEQVVKIRNTTSSIIAQGHYSLETIRVKNSRLMVPSKLEDRQFVLFDVNGHEIRRGTLVNNMVLPAYPVVIKIQGFGTQLLQTVGN